MRHSQQHSHSSNPPEWRGRLMWMVKMRRMLVILLKQKEIVGSCHRDDVLLRMPGRVQDLLVEVQTVHGDLVLLPLAPGAHLQHTVKLIDIYKNVVLTLRGLSIVFGLATSLDASNVTSFRVLRSNILRI